MRLLPVVMWLALAVPAAWAQVPAPAAPDGGPATSVPAPTENARHYRLDVLGGSTKNTFGSAWGAAADFAAYLDPNNTLEATARTNSRELVTNNPLDASTLPSRSLRLGYHWQQPAQYGIAVGYETRHRSASPTEKLLDMTVHATVNTKIDVFAGHRRGYGTGFQSRMTFAGLTYRFTDAWSATSTLFSAKSSMPGTPDPKAVALDLVYAGTGDLLVIVGGSQGRNPSLSDVHARVVYPVGKDSALLVIARRNTFNSETQVEVGWRQYWK
jgi:hypothetical protein